MTPDERRVFVYGKTGWFERVEGQTGAAEFTPVADSEEELRNWLAEGGEPDLVEIDDQFAAQVREEFLEQSPLYPETSEPSRRDKSGSASDAPAFAVHAVHVERSVIAEDFRCLLDLVPASGMYADHRLLLPRWPEGQTPGLACL